MQRQLYNIGATRLLLPKRLWFLVQNFWKPVDRTFEQSLWHNSKYLYYVKEWWISIETNVSTVYWSLEKAKEIQKQNDWRFIMEELNSKWTTREKYSKQNQELQEENEQLKKENEELKSLPPVEVEHVWLDPNGSPYPKFDDPQDENLTNSRKRGRSNWEK